MRIRIRRRQAAVPQFDVGWRCAKCGRDRYFKFGHERHCSCGCVTGTIIYGRYEDIAAGQQSAVESVTHDAPPRRMRARLARKQEHGMAKLKIVTRKTAAAAEAPATKAAAPVKTGSKVVKTKEGKGAGSSGRFLGVRTGLSVTKYQNKTFEDQPKKKLTDLEIVMDWKREFPGARADYTTDTVRGVRGAFNRGAHGNDAPAKPVPEYDDARQPLPIRGAAKAERRAVVAGKGQPALPPKKGKAKAAPEPEVPAKKLRKMVKA